MRTSNSVILLTGFDGWRISGGLSLAHIHMCGGMLQSIMAKKWDMKGLGVNEKIKEWLLESQNPAIKYRTETELLGLHTDATDVKKWIFERLPADWFDKKGLWYIYYINAFAECGLGVENIPIKHLGRAIEKVENNFQFGCSDFMLLHVLVKLGLYEHESVRRTIECVVRYALPDGGYLCNNRIKKLTYPQKVVTRPICIC